jgi:hypothetical protein
MMIYNNNILIYDSNIKYIIIIFDKFDFNENYIYSLRLVILFII